jgi:phosphohistidine swiveling domain-containing protein
MMSVVRWGLGGVTAAAAAVGMEFEMAIVVGVMEGRRCM